MGKKDEQKANLDGHDSGGIKVRVIEFELHGRNATVSEGIKAITQAISGRTIIVSEPKHPALPAVSKPDPETTTATVVVTEMEEQSDAANVPVEAEEAGLPDTPTNGNNGTGQKRQYNFKTPKYMDDLDFSKATKSLEDFWKEKGSPTDIMDKYILTVVWFKQHMGTEEVTIGHVYTVFDNVGWKSEMPANPSITLRDLKSKKHMLTRETGAEGYKANFKGEQYVEKMGATK